MDGTILAGQDFAVEKVDVGSYRITFAPGRMSGFPIAVVTLFDNATRNERHFETTGIDWVNPWTVTG